LRSVKFSDDDSDGCGFCIYRRLPFTDRTVCLNNEACRYYVGLPLQGLLPTGATQSYEY